MGEQEQAIFNIIASSGDSRGMAFKALRCARDGQFEEAHKLMDEAKEKSSDAHDAQTKLIQDEINGKTTEVSLLMVHAQDHLMTSMLARDLIDEMIDILEGKRG